MGSPCAVTARPRLPDRRTGSARYSPGARPKARWAYRGSELAADTVALIDALAVGKVHLVGHDWGAAVAWQVAAERPDLLDTVTAVSVPHPLAFVKAMVTSTQGLKSWYMGAFQLPFVPPEKILSSTSAGEKFLISSGQTPENARRDLNAMLAPGRLRGGLNWYRAMWMTKPNPPATARVTVPTCTSGVTATPPSAPPKGLRSPPPRLSTARTGSRFSAA